MPAPATIRSNALPRRSLVGRRIRSGAVLLVVLGFVIAWLVYQRQNLQRDSFTSGYLLIGAVCFLAAYNLRKRLPFIPWLGTSAGWMQLHIYVGLGSFALFAWHVGLRMPSGILESCLAGLYLAVFASGVLGLFWTRTIPRRLTAIRDQVIYEQIPAARRLVVAQVRTLLFDSPAKSLVLCRFYVQRLAVFFEQPREVAYLVRPSGSACRGLLNEIEDLNRYLSPAHRETGRMLAELVRRKDDLDYHQALQGRLKVWLFVHIGLTYGLILFALVHAVAVHAFHGGIP